MDAVKFIEERRRMFAMIGENSKYSLFNMNTRAEDIVKEVEEWSAVHPRKTRQDAFLEQWPNAEFDKQGILLIDPCDLDSTRREKDRDCYNENCYECRREFWMQEVE